MKYVAFLRGINIGGRIIKKDELKTCFENAGLENVKTVIQSGNVLFESGLKEAELKNKIELALTKTFNYPAKVWVLSVDKIQKIVDANPFANASKEYHQYVIFFENGLEKDFAAEPMEQDEEEVKVGEGVVYWKVLKGKTLKSQKGKLTGASKYRNSLTNRNINTLNRMFP